tara:strand:+ start:10933 stop:11214 length:282 start_codon:yes stop_codon:yes gene_type:complete
LHKKDKEHSMEHIEKFKDFLTEAEKVNEAGDYMSINEFSDAFEEFFQFIENNKKFIDNDTLKELKKAMPLLNKALETEAVAHGVDFTSFKLKL